jgi:hypothetical protein
MKRNQTLHTETGGTSRHKGRMARLAVAFALTSILLLAATCGAPSPTAETTTEPQQPPPGEPPAEATEPPAPPEATEPPAPPPVETVSPYAEGSMVRASYDPAAGWGPPDVHEDFEGTSGLFTAVSGGAANSYYDDGAFHITFTTRGWWTWYFGDVGLRPSFYTDVVITNGDHCVDRDSAGLLLRGDQTADSGLLFGVTCKGGYYIGVSSGPGAGGPICMFNASAWNSLAGDFDCSGLPLHNMSEHIQAGPGAVNRIGVLGNGTSYEMYVNGRLVGRLQDNVTPIVLPPGWIGGHPALFLGAGQQDNSEVSFDDFSLWRNP